MAKSLPCSPPGLQPAACLQVSHSLVHFSHAGMPSLSVFDTHRQWETPMSWLCVQGSAALEHCSTKFVWVQLSARRTETESGNSSSCWEQGLLWRLQSDKDPYWKLTAGCPPCPAIPKHELWWGGGWLPLKMHPGLFRKTNFIIHTPSFLLLFCLCECISVSA